MPLTFKYNNDYFYRHDGGCMKVLCGLRHLSILADAHVDDRRRSVPWARRIIRRPGSEGKRIRREPNLIRHSTIPFTPPPLTHNCRVRPSPSAPLHTDRPDDGSAWPPRGQKID